MTKYQETIRGIKVEYEVISDAEALYQKCLAYYGSGDEWKAKRDLDGEWMMRLYGPLTYTLAGFPNLAVARNRARCLVPNHQES